MLDTMIEKGQIGSYKVSYDHAVAGFAAKDPAGMAEKSGVPFDADLSVFKVHSLGQNVNIHYPSGRVWFEGSDSNPIWSWGFILMHHLARADGAPLGQEKITFRETGSGAFFYPSFKNKTLDLLTNFFSDKPAQKIIEACRALDAAIGGGADVCADFYFAPRFPVTLGFWLPDEEFGASANLLYDSAANHYLHTEDIVVASTIIVKCLIEQYKNMFI